MCLNLKLNEQYDQLAKGRGQSLENAFSNSMHPVKDLLKYRFESMKLIDNHMQCFPPSSDEGVKEFCEVIQERIHTSISFDNLDDATLSRIDAYKSFEDSAFQQLTYSRLRNAWIKVVVFVHLYVFHLMYLMTCILFRHPF